MTSLVSESLKSKNLQEARCVDTTTGSILFDVFVVVELLGISTPYLCEHFTTATIIACNLIWSLELLY